MKLAIFDFCKTLVSINSLSKFVEFVIDNSKNTKSKYIKKFILKNKGIICKILNIKPRYVEIKLLQGYSEEELSTLARRFFDECITVHINHNVVSQLKKLKNQGYIIVILSAALDIYLKYIRKLLPVDYVVCTRLKFINKICQGKIEGKDVYGDEKLTKITEFFSNSNIEWENSYYFTDDYITEIKLLEKVGNPFVVIEKAKKHPSLNPKIKFLQV